MVRQILIVVWIAIVTLLPTFWNACGNVSFEQAQSGLGKNCVAAGGSPDDCDSGVITQHSQSIAVKSSSSIDILFVVDNSLSMQEEQIGIGNKINGFLDKIKGLDWQIAITSTDANSYTTGGDNISYPWGDGQFRPFDSNTGSEYILKPSQNSLAVAQTKLASAIDFGTKGSFLERGINAATRSVLRAANPSANKDFFRANAGLAVIVISDEDECSNGLQSCPSSSYDYSNPTSAISSIKSVLGSQKLVSFSSIIYIPGDQNCSTGKNQGNTYKQITELTGGVMGSVCSNDYTSALNVLGQRVVELISSVALECPPLDMNKDGIQDVTVTLPNGSVMSSGFIVKGTTLTFTQSLPEGVNKFDYFCK